VWESINQASALRALAPKPKGSAVPVTRLWVKMLWTYWAIPLLCVGQVSVLTDSTLVAKRVGIC
jgi:hypothetical protein